MTASPTAPDAMPSEEEIARLEKALRYSAATASNDDYTQRGTVERTRHVDRVTAMLEAADALALFAPILAEKDAIIRAERFNTENMRKLAAKQKAAGKEYYERALAAEAALAGERERCAKIAEQFSNAKPGDICEVQAAEWQYGIAAAIRAEP